MAEDLKQSMITTFDNPYSPFSNFEAWYAFDEAKGYGTLSTLAALVVTSEDLSDADQELAIDYAIDGMLEYDYLGIYQKVFKKDEEVEED
jgi:hypothetical protein